MSLHISSASQVSSHKAEDSRALQVPQEHHPFWLLAGQDISACISKASQAHTSPKPEECTGHQSCSPVFSKAVTLEHYRKPWNNLSTSTRALYNQPRHQTAGQSVRFIIEAMIKKDRPGYTHGQRQILYGALSQSHRSCVHRSVTRCG